MQAWPNSKNGCWSEANKKGKLEANKAYFDETFSEIRENMATKSCIDKLHSTIKEQSERIEILESKIAVMEEHFALQQNSVD